MKTSVYSISIAALLRSFCCSVVLALFATNLISAPFFWVAGNSSNVWNNAANWSATSGGAGGAGIPGMGDNVTFDNGGMAGAVTITSGIPANIVNLVVTGMRDVTLQSATLTINSLNVNTAPSRLTLGTGMSLIIAPSGTGLVTLGGTLRTNAPGAVLTVRDGATFTNNSVVQIFGGGGKFVIAGNPTIAGSSNINYGSANDTLEFVGMNTYMISATAREVTAGSMTGTILVNKPGGIVNGIMGTLNVQGSFLLQQGTWNVNAGGRLVMNGMAGTTGIIQPSSTLAVKDNGVLEIAHMRTLNNNGTINIESLSPIGGRLEIAGTGQIGGMNAVNYLGTTATLSYTLGNPKTTNSLELPQTMPGALSINKMGAVTPVNLGSPTNIFGTLSINTGTLNTGSNLLQISRWGNIAPLQFLVVQTNGVLLINNGTKLGQEGTLFIQNRGTLRLEGDGSVEGTPITYAGGSNLFYTGGTNRFPGSAEMQVPGTLDANLHINKTSGTELQIPGSAGDILTLGNNASLAVTSGIVRSGEMANGMVFVSNPSALSVTFATTGFGYVQGQMRRAIANSINSYFFPLGTAGRFLPFALGTTNVSLMPILQVGAYNGMIGGAAPGTRISSISSTENWQIEEVNGGTINLASVGLFRSGGWTKPSMVARVDTPFVYNGIGGTETLNGLVSDFVQPVVPFGQAYFAVGAANLPVKSALGYQLLFNGSNQTVVASPRAAYDSLQSFTMEALVRPYWFVGTPGYDPCIFSFGDAGSQNFSLNVGQLNAFLKVSTNSGATTVQRSVMPTFRRYNYAHIAVSYNAGVITYYVDGRLMGTDNISLSPVGGKPFYIGSRGGITEFWQGNIDEVRIWNTPLPQSVIASWRRRELDASHPNGSNLIGYWRFNEGYSQIAADRSTQENTASLINTPIWMDASTTSNVIVAPTVTSTGQLTATKIGTGSLTYSLIGANGGSTCATVNLGGSGSISYTPIGNIIPDVRDTVIHSVSDNIPSQTTASIVVEFSPVINVNTQFVSFNKPTRFTAPSFFGGTSPFIAQWSPTTNLTNTNTLQPTATLITNATYTLQFGDNYGFGSTFPVSAQIHPLVLAFSNSSSTATTGFPALVNSGNPVAMRYSVFRRRTGQFDSTDASVALRVDAAPGGNAQFAVNYTRTFTNTASILETGIVINWLNAPLAGGSTQAIVTLYRTSGAPIDPVQLQITISSNATAPIVTSFAPSIGGGGTFVTITGANFVNVGNVRFGGIPAQSFMVISPTEIRAQVAAGGGTGLVAVTAMAGSGNSAGVFQFVQPPTITSFTPQQGTSGATVQVLGSNFIAPVTVRFGGVPGTNVDIVSPTQLFVDVGPGATGNVNVTTPGGTVTSATIFTFFGAPIITSIVPTQGTAGDTITVNGNNFQLIDSVRIGGQVLTGANGTVLSSASQTQVRIVLSTTPLSGVVSIFAAAGQASSSQVFTYIPPPKIDSIVPRVGGAGTVVNVFGKNFIQVDSVRFGGVRLQSLMVTSTSALSAQMPTGLVNSTNAIIVFARAGRDTSKTPNLFQYVLPPQITSFTSAAGSGAWVQITGANLVSVSSVQFGGVPADSIRTMSPSLVLARVAAGASGKISLVAAGGSVQSQQDFRFLRPPTITAFTPSSGATGATVEITGTEFVNVTNVSIGGGSVASFSVANDTRIIATLSNNATSGTIRVSTLQGLAQSTQSFQVIISAGPPPSIISFTPPSGEAGTEVFISGQNLAAANNVTFAGVTAASFRVISATVVAAIVPTGATSGSIRITTPNGIATSVLDFRFILPNSGGENLTPLQRDSIVLVRLYNVTGGGAWAIERNWLTERPLSSWSGVRVEQGRVTSLELSNNALLGALPLFVAELSALKVLDLSGNQLSGSVPSSIGTMSALEVIRLRRNGFSGAFPQLATNANLQVFDIGQNRFVGDIPRGLCNAVNLREVRLDSNGFSGVLPPCLGNLQRVEIFDASQNLLADSIPAAIGSMTALRELLLAGNGLTGTIPQTLGTQATVRLLADNGKQATLQAVPNLQRLDLSRNRLTGLIPSSLGDCRALRTVQLSQNQLTGNLPLSFGNLTQLQTLDCSRNQLSGALPTFWGNLRQLQTLSLRNNRFSGAIPLEIGRLSALTTMWLDSNTFTSMSDSIQQISALQRISLANNRLTALPQLRRTSGIALDSVNVAGNALTFESLERNFSSVRAAVYSPQDSVLSRIDTTVRVFSRLRFSSTVGGLFNDYQWYRAGRVIVGATDSVLLVERFARADTGDYTCFVRNRVARELTLIRQNIRIRALPPQAPSERPLLLQPQALAQNVSIIPTFVWTTTAFTSLYEIEFSQQQDFASAATVRLTSNDPFRSRLTLVNTQALQFLTTYFWRVRAVSEGLPGAWSDVGRFTTLPEGQTLNVESLNFGRVLLQRSVERSVTIQNLSGTRIIIHSVRLSEPTTQTGGQFTVSGFTSAQTLEADSTISFRVRFVPRAVGEQVANVVVGYTIASAGAVPPTDVTFTNALTARGGVLGFVGEELDFGTVTAGLSKTESVQLTNIGTSALTLVPRVIARSENTEIATFGFNDVFTNAISLQAAQQAVFTLNCTVKPRSQRDSVRGSVQFVAQVGTFSDTLTIPTFVRVRPPDSNDIVLLPRISAEQQGVVPGGIVTILVKIAALDTKAILERSTQGTVQERSQFALGTLQRATPSSAAFTGDITMNRQVLIPANDETQLTQGAVTGDIASYTFTPTRWVPDMQGRLDSTLVRFRCRVVAGNTDTSALKITRFVWDTTRSQLSGGTVSQVIVRSDTLPQYFAAGVSKAGGKRLIGSPTMKALSIFPNPSGEKLTVRFTVPSAEYLTLELVTLQGTVLMRLAEGQYNEGTYTNDWSLQSLPSGVYLVRLKNSESVIQERLHVIR
ncbi:MAG: IPT/TIG domain-containing protein [Candidatus Kapabacteria bacterium]|nr:IPT/TIG domain-containing protein [Candidatus Kapabacteria bacterium]